MGGDRVDRWKRGVIKDEVKDGEGLIIGDGE